MSQKSNYDVIETVLVIAFFDPRGPGHARQRATRHQAASEFGTAKYDDVGSGKMLSPGITAQNRDYATQVSRTTDAVSNSAPDVGLPRRAHLGHTSRSRRTTYCSMELRRDEPTLLPAR
jgi:hypothetical protein